ncbi:MAG TPA: potassium channel family protein [Kineosporiaceae bacterium]|nr:potassium channel family protein [Kineosporiaceae bacterium]
MSSLLLFWRHLFGQDVEPRRRAGVATDEAVRAEATIFLVLRRMRAPLIILILIFAVTVLGLVLIPGRDAQGNTYRMGFFDAFYFMSYTASTIGFGELPHAFTDAQRMWVLVSIYLTVIGWAYAIGTLLTLLQDRAFRNALAMQRFTRKVQRLREPFLLIAGYGNTGELLGRSWDALGRGFVAVDISADRIDSLDVDPYNADVPGLVADACNPSHLEAAGLQHPYCEGVVALTNNDEANLAVTMAAALLRPELPVIARTVSPAIEERMQAFGTPTVVNPFDRFGDHLRLAVKAPASYQLLSWFEGGPGSPLPGRCSPPAHGRWVICGYGRFGQELYADLRAEGHEVTIIDSDAAHHEHPSIVIGDASEPTVMARAEVETAVGFVAGTNNDTTNLSLIAAARRRNRNLYTAARQNQPANAPLFAAMALDLLLVPSEVVAREAYARLSTPLFWRFLQEIPGQSEEWALDLLDHLTRQCGQRMPELWKVRMNPEEAPALTDWLESGEAALGDLLRDPQDRDQRLPVTPLLQLHDDRTTLCPRVEAPLSLNDEVLFVGTGAGRRAMETTMTSRAGAAYAVSGSQVAASWVWRKFASS